MKLSVGAELWSGKFSRSLRSLKWPISVPDYTMALILEDEGAHLQKIKKIMFGLNLSYVCYGQI